MKTNEAMYTLGQLVRALWPRATAELPMDVIEKTLVAPASGLGLLKQRPEWAAADQDELGALMDRLPADICDPEGGVPEEHQGRFWIGFYHYAAALDAARHYGPDDMERAGQALFGGRWQSDLARAIGVDSRRVRQWMADERPIPPGVWADIAGLLRQRQIRIGSVLRAITED